MLIDSNILIYSLNQASPKQLAAQRFLQSVPQLLFAQQNIFETLRILTHTKFPNPFPPNEAVEAVRVISDNAKIITPSFETFDLALELVTKYQVKGTDVFDAYLVATAMSYGITQIATDNTQHLGKYEEIKVFNPLR